MATKIIEGKFMPQYKTAAQWSIANPVLLRGETGVESDTRKFKFGDGVNHWNDLEYANKAYPADIKMTDWAKMLESAYSPITNTDTLLAALQKLQVLVDNGDAYLFRCYGTNSTMSGVAFGSPDGSRGLRAICYNSWVNKILVCAGEITLPAFIRMSETEQAAWLGEHTEHSMPVEDILLGTNILNGSHEDWIESTIGGGYKDIPGGAIYLDHTVMRGKQITYRVELKGEDAQALQLGFEIKVHFTDNTDQWIARYSTGDIPDRGTFEKAYTFSSQIQDKEIEYARLYPVFRSLSGGEASGKLYVRHEFVGVGNKLPSTWSPSVADQKKYIDDKVENIQIGGVNIFSFSELEQGAINNSTGVPAASNTRLRSKSFYPISGKYISVNSFNDIYKFLWLFYDEEYSHIDDRVSWDWITSFPTVAEIPEGAAYVKYEIGRNDNAVLTPDDAKEDCLIKVELGNKPSLSWSPSVADLQVTAPVTISDFKNLPSVVTSAADGVIIPIIAPVSASNGPAGLSSAGPAYGHVQVAKTGSTKAYNFLVQMDGSGATKVYSGFLHSTAQTVSWTELGGNSGGRLRDVKYLGTSFWALISSNDTDIQAFVVDENSPEVPAEYKGEGFGFAKHYRDDVGMATVTIKLNSGSVKTFNVTFYGDGSDAYWEETGGSSGSSLPFDGPIPGYELVYSNTSAVLQLASGTEVMINFDKAIPAAQMFTSKARFMIEADIVNVSGNTLSNVVRVPIAIFKPTAAGQPVFEYMIQSIATGTNIGRVRLIITSWIREAGSTGDITGCNLMAQVNNLNPSMNYALTFPGMYVKSSGGGQ
ncbi:hypothetical protein [Alistipes putredinis]|uniref:hyaluronate lyase N-terminal domain-containing protein n=1 Tax=Alistipes putredinis TaxID=28117 RepID=UPI003AB8CB8F